MVDVAATPPPDWDAFVAGHAGATAYHRAAAVAIGRNCFGLRTMFLTARDATGCLTGVLPLVEQSSMLFGRFLGSVPFFTYGGALAEDARTAAALAERAGQLARERRAKHVELRQAEPIADLALPQRLDKVSMVLALPKSEERLAKQLGAKLRSQIRRADREAPEVVWGNTELLPEFYRIFAPVMHELGTPVYPERFFHTALKAFGDLAAVLVIRVRGEARAAAITVRHGPKVEVPWAAATGAAKRTSLNMRMYWELLRSAIQSGAESFDFGRCTVGSGTYRFKEQWRAVPRQLHWYYWLPAGAALPMLNHTNPKYAMAAALWRRMPLWCANFLGPQIVRHLP
jgi:FemAB-related protein (PEP-CTERM system-associated)